MGDFFLAGVSPHKISGAGARDMLILAPRERVQRYIAKLPQATTNFCPVDMAFSLYGAR